MKADTNFALPAEGGLTPELAFVVVESAPDAILVAGADGLLLFANARAETLFGRPRRSLVGRPVEDLVPERLRCGHEKHSADHNASPQGRPMGVGAELWALGPDGSEVPVQISLSPATIGDDSVTIVALREVGEHRAAEAEVREALLAEDEQRFATELHNRVIEPILRAAMGIQSVQRLAGDPLATRLAEAVDQLDLAVREIRDAVFGLRPPRAKAR